MVVDPRLKGSPTIPLLSETGQRDDEEVPAAGLTQAPRHLGGGHSAASLPPEEGALGEDPDRGPGVGRELPPNAELRQHDLVAAGAALAAIEDEYQGHAPLRDDQVGAVAPRNDDLDGLAVAFRRRTDFTALSEEEGVENRDQGGPRAQGDDPVRGHGEFLPPRPGPPASRRLLPTTETEERAMAADAIMGESIQPVTG